MTEDQRAIMRTQNAARMAAFSRLQRTRVRNYCKPWRWERLMDHGDHVSGALASGRGICVVHFAVWQEFTREQTALPLFPELALAILWTEGHPMPYEPDEDTVLPNGNYVFAGHTFWSWGPA